MERMKVSSLRGDPETLRGLFIKGDLEALRGPFSKGDQETPRGPFANGDQDTAVRGSYLYGDQDTVRVSKCGCVPQLSLVYEDVGKEAPSWARRIPLFGPLWCVSGATGTRVRRR